MFFMFVYFFMLLRKPVEKTSLVFFEDFSKNIIIVVIIKRYKTFLCFIFIELIRSDVIHSF